MATIARTPPGSTSKTQQFCQLMAAPTITIASRRTHNPSWHTLMLLYEPDLSVQQHLRANATVADIIRDVAVQSESAAAHCCILAKS
jgi:hypothetical protein